MLKKLFMLALLAVALYGGYLAYTEVLQPMIANKEAMGDNAYPGEADE